MPRRTIAKLDAAAVSKLLRELAQRLELAGGNPYRARAYSRAAENLLLSPLPLEQLIAEDRLTEIPGIGDAIAASPAVPSRDGSPTRRTRAMSPATGRSLMLLPSRGGLMAQRPDEFFGYTG